jgi:hypothetical protein
MPSTSNIFGLNVFWSRGLAVQDQQLLSLAMELRARAQEIAARAETFHDADVRQTMHGIASSYEKLAERLERRARDEGEV